MTGTRKKLLWASAAVLGRWSPLGTVVFVEVVAAQHLLRRACHYIGPLRRASGKNFHPPRGGYASTATPPNAAPCFRAGGCEVRHGDPRIPAASRLRARRGLLQVCHEGVDKAPVKFLNAELPPTGPTWGTDRARDPAPFAAPPFATVHQARRPAHVAGGTAASATSATSKARPPRQTVAGCAAPVTGPPRGNAKHGGFLFDMKSYVESRAWPCSPLPPLGPTRGTGRVPREQVLLLPRVPGGDGRRSPRRSTSSHVTVKEIRCLECHEPIRHGTREGPLGVLEVQLRIECHCQPPRGRQGDVPPGVGAKAAHRRPARMFAAQINCTGQPYPDPDPGAAPPSWGRGASTPRTPAPARPATGRPLPSP